MNRQVLPSMVLSVLIVCFFAVVLFPLERDREQAVKAGVASKAAEPPVASGPNSPPPKPSSAVAAVEPPRQAVAPTSVASPSLISSPAPEPAASVAVESPKEAARPAEVASLRESPRNPVLASTPPGAPSRAATAEAPRAPAPTAAAPVPAAAPAPSPPPNAPAAVVKEPARVEKPDEPPPVAAAKEKAPEPARPEPSPSRSEPASIPRGDPEMTVVDQGETLEDVAIRVYGTRAGVETLLSANREVLTRRKGPLRTGLQLWTPVP